MPVFHTKTMEMILEPVAQQVAQLVVMHEDAEDGNAMPDLHGPVQTVRSAVENLIQVGYQTLNNSKDSILKHDMPPALNRVEEASLELVKATQMLRDEPFSDPARKKLIEGSRGILQGTSGLLLAFDESEVRKIVARCKAVLEYLAIAEVVEVMQDLVTYIEQLTPGLTDMTKLVDSREKELTHATHREWLTTSLIHIKSLVPALITTMKAYCTTKLPESMANRDFIVKQIAEEIIEMIRVLQLTTLDEDDWDADDITIMKRTMNMIEAKMPTALGWLANPVAPTGGSGPAAMKQVLESARKVAELCCNPSEQAKLMKKADDIEKLFESLCELRAQGKGNTPMSMSLQTQIQSQLKELQALTKSTIENSERSGIQRPAQTISGKVEQALRWLAAPNLQDNGLGEKAARMVVEEGRKAAQICTGAERAELHRLCDDVERATMELKNLVAQGRGNSPEALALAQDLSKRLPYLQKKIEDAWINKVVEDFVDTTTPLKQLSDAAFAPLNVPNREETFGNRAGYFEHHAKTLADTAQAVAVNMSSGPHSKANVSKLLKSTQAIKELAPQITFAAKIVLTDPSNQVAADNFTQLKGRWVENMETLRGLVDDAVDTAAFIQASEEAIRRDTERVEQGVTVGDSSRIVGNAASIARRANRVKQVAQQEAENSDDPVYVQRVNNAAEMLGHTIAPVVTSAKDLAINPQNPQAANLWRKNNNNLLDKVVGVKLAVTVADPVRFPPPPDMSQLNISASRRAPPPPPPPPQPPVFKKPQKSPTDPHFPRTFESPPVYRIKFAPTATDPVSRYPVPDEADFMAKNQANLQNRQNQPNFQSQENRQNQQSFPSAQDLQNQRNLLSQRNFPNQQSLLQQGIPDNAVQDVMYKTERGQPQNLQEPFQNLPGQSQNQEGQSENQQGQSQNDRGQSQNQKGKSENEQGHTENETQFQNQQQQSKIQRKPSQNEQEWSNNQLEQIEKQVEQCQDQLEQFQDPQEHTEDQQEQTADQLEHNEVQHEQAEDQLEPFQDQQEPIVWTTTVSMAIVPPRPIVLNLQDAAEVQDGMSQKQQGMSQNQQEQSLRTAPMAPIPPPPVPPPPQDNFYSTYYGGDSAPPRPPPPSMPPTRPPPPETDDEDETFFPLPQPNQPIMVAAHDLHMEAKQWSSKDNEIIAAAKRMAILMAKLSMIVRGEGGSKKELIDTAKKIVEASKDVTKAARALSHECTDKRVRTALLQVCERIPTIGTQLKILSTVKATMLGAQGSEEDQEATEMLVGNAEILMKSVKDTVRAAEAASIRIRVDSGYSIRWLRRKPWYT